MANNSLQAKDAASQSGTFTFDAGSVAAHSGTTSSIGLSGAKTTDVIVVTISSTYGGNDPSVTPEQASLDDVIRLLFCNPSGIAVELPSLTYTYALWHTV